MNVSKKENALASIMENTRCVIVSGMAGSRDTSDVTKTLAIFLYLFFCSFWFSSLCVLA